MKKIRLRRFAALAVTFCAATAFATAAVPARAELEKVIIRVSADLPPPPHPTAVAMEWFKDQVEATFPEGSEVRNFYAGALYKDPDAMMAMTQGSLEMAWIMSGKSAAVDEWFGIVGQPGVLTTVAAIHDLSNLSTGKMLLDRLRKKHFIEPFGFADLSFALSMAGKERLLTLDSFKGKKIRTFAASLNPVVASWGASPVVMSFGDVPSALESGVLDGVITSIGGWRSITEQTPYYTIAGISTVTFDNYWVGASKAWFDNLNADSQAKIRELIGGAMTYQDELNWCNDQFAIREFKAEKPSDPGIYVATPAEAKPLQEAIGNNVSEYLKGRLPEEAHAWVDTFQKEGRAASERLASGTDPVESLDCAPYEAALKR